MKALTWGLAILLAVAVAILISIGGSNKDLGQQAELLQQKIDGQGTIIKEKSAEYIHLQRETGEKIAELNGMVDSSNTVIAHKEEEIATQDDKLGELREAQKILINDRDIIENLKQQIFLLDKKFTLARSELREKDKVIFALNEKYEYEHTLRLQADNLLEKLSRQGEDKILLIQNLKKQLAHQKRVSLYEKLGVGVACLLLGVLVE